MLQADRRNDILKRLEEHPSVTVKELSSFYGISEVSVRKLLAQMEEEELLRRTWGGAVRITKAAQEFSYKDKTERNRAEKKAIAEVAYSFIKNGETVYIDTGTTSDKLAEKIIAGDKQLIVVTNAFNILGMLREAKHIREIMVGGELRPEIYSCVGPLALAVLDRIVVDRAFITGDHFSPEHGFSVSMLADAELKRKVLEISRRNYVLMDSSKFGSDSMAIFSKAGDGHTLITDWKLSPEAEHAMEKAGTHTICAPQVGE